MTQLEMPPMPQFLRRNHNHQQGTEMTRTARLKEHEGRTLPDLTSPPQESASNGPDRDEFLFSIGHQKKLQQAIDDAKLGMKRFRNSLKLRGFNLKMMDLAIEEADREDGTTISNMRDLKRYYEFMNLPIGHQFALFDTPQAANANVNDDLMAKAFAEGRERGVKGEFPDEQKWLPVSPEGQEHQRGWAEGQAVHLAKFKSLTEALAESDKIAEAKAAKKAAKAKAAAEDADEDDGDEEEGEDMGPADDEPTPPPPEAKATTRRRGGRAAAH